VHAVLRKPLDPSELHARLAGFLSREAAPRKG